MEHKGDFSIIEWGEQKLGAQDGVKMDWAQL